MFQNTGLSIITNEKLGLMHGGNPDRDDPAMTYDGPEKHAGCISVAKNLINSTFSERPFPDGAYMPGSRIELNDVSEPATGLPRAEEQIERIIEEAHSRRYRLSLLKRSEEAGKQNAILDFGPEAVVSRGTYDAAFSAVAASLDMVDRIIQNKGTSFALVWPPGHHAEKEQAMGFCYFNNAAAAAIYASSFGLNVAVIDCDNHTANGTREILRNRKNIAVVDMDYAAEFDSRLNVYLDGKGQFHTEERSDGTVQLAGKGTYFNQGKEYPYRHKDILLGNVAHEVAFAENILEVRSPEMKESRMLVDLYLDKVLPWLKKFKPDVIIWSVGLDSLMGDPLGGLGHTPGSFYTMLLGTKKSFPEARHGGVMEGGYDPVRWHRGLPSALLALHDDPLAAPKRSRIWKEYAVRFNP